MNPTARFVNNISNGAIRGPTPVDGNGIYYTDPYSVHQAHEARIKSTTPNSGAENFLRDTIALDKSDLKEKSKDLDLKSEDSGLESDKVSISEISKTVSQVVTDWRRENPEG